jgi:hypothetical protein
MNREIHVRICGGLEVQSLRSTRRGSNAKGETQIGSPYKSESTEVEPRDGLPRSSREVPVMGMERRGQVTQLALVANR